MESNRGNKRLTKVYYVDAGKSGLLAVPAERMVEINQVKCEQHRRQAEGRAAFCSFRTS